MDQICLLSSEEHLAIYPLGKLLATCTSCRSNHTTEVSSLQTSNKRDMNSMPYNGTNNTKDNISSNNTSGSSPTLVSLLEQSIALKCFIFVLSLSAVSANVVVIKIVFTTPRLKRINAMFLAAHTAICDLLISVFLLAAVIRATIPTNELEKGHVDVWERYICPTITSARSLAMLVEPFFLFLMTLNRYKLIVNHSKPSTHLTNRSVLIATCIVWITSSSIVGGQVVGFSFKNQLKGILCQVAPSDKNYFLYIEKAGIATSSVLFILCCIMYHRIYKVVKNQNEMMGSRTYVRVSKLIFALVISSLIFWYVPAMTVAFIGGHKAVREIRSLTIFISFTMNSLVNPFLYVFRENKFRRELFSMCNACPTIRKPVQSVRRIEIKPRGGEQSASNDETEASNVWNTSL